MTDLIYTIVNSEALARFFSYAGVLLLAILLIVGIVLLVRHLDRRTLSLLTYKREFEETGVYESEELTFTETIYNRSIFPIFFVDVESYMFPELDIDGAFGNHVHSMQLIKSRFHLLPYMQIIRRHKVKCLKRGHYTLESVDICKGNFSVNVNSKAELYVYPKLIDTKDLSRPSSILQGELLSRRRLIEDPFSLSGIRDYCPGDPFNIINFKATAKSAYSGGSGIRVNNRDHSSSRIMMLYLNFALSPGESMTTLEYEEMMEEGLSFASALIHDALYNGYRAGFAANCTTTEGNQSIFFPVESGEMHLKEILMEMAKIRPREGISPYALLGLGNSLTISNSDIIFISNTISSEVSERLEYFKNLNNNVEFIHLGREPGTGSVLKAGEELAI